MKKGCLLWLLQVAVLAGLYHLAFHRWFISPEDWLVALGGGVALTLVIGAFRNAWSARKGRALLDHALTGAPFEDGKRIAAVGPILALGSPIPAPLSGDPCVFCAWGISHESSIQRRRSRPQSVKDFGGFVMTPCVVQTPTGNVRILGFPLLEGFPEKAQRSNGDFMRARAYLQSTSFENLGVTKVFSEMKDLLVDQDGHLRKDWRMAGDDFQLNPDIHTLKEQIIKDGDTVCALGLYSAERKGLVPGHGHGGAGIKLIRGDSAAARKTLTVSLWKYSVVGVLLFLVTHVLLLSFVAVRRSEVPTGKQAREAAFFQAVKDRDLATVTAELGAGLDPNTRDGYGNTPLMVVADPRVARRLISAGADVNARNQDDATPLIEAAKTCNLEVVRLLLQSGADVKARDNSEDRSALDWARVWDPQDKNYEEVATVLRNAGATERSP